ncbi:MAG: NUDIX hydrolase [Firmicutes bacterium]|nr:NUDIX hydrolase [Bacillota bacterium]
MWTGGVRVIIENDEQKILMVKQEHPERTVWMVPGGGIEEGETAAEAVVREMKEETGLDVTVGPMIFHIEEVSEKRGQRFVNFFMATVAGGDMHLGMDPEFDAEHQVLKELKFLSREEIQALPHVYPEFLRDEVWGLLDAGKLYDAFRIREPWKK